MELDQQLVCHLTKEHRTAFAIKSKQITYIAQLYLELFGNYIPQMLRY